MRVILILMLFFLCLGASFGQVKLTAESQPVALRIGQKPIPGAVNIAHTKLSRGDEIVLQRQMQTGTKAYALIIGVGAYINGWQALSNPIKDAQKLHAILRDQYIFEELKLLENPDRLSILSAVESYSTKIGENDHLLIFFAGHGNFDKDMGKDGEGYWIPSDGRKTLKASWLKNKSITDYFFNMPAKHILVIADACYAGSYFRGDIDEAMKDARGDIAQLYVKKSRKAMTSGALEAVPDKSLFLYYLAEDLKNNTKKVLPARDLFREIETSIRENSPNSPVPQYGQISETGHNGGEFVFIRK